MLPQLLLVLASCRVNKLGSIYNNIQIAGALRKRNFKIMLYRGNGTEVGCSSTWCFIVVVLFFLQQNNQLSWTTVYAFSRNATESAELMTNYESSLSLSDILPIPPRQYDKNRAPKLLGQPTVVYFHVTVLSLDSINEESMVAIPLLETLITHTQQGNTNI